MKVELINKTTGEVVAVCSKAASMGEAVKALEPTVKKLGLKQVSYRLAGQDSGTRGRGYSTTAFGER